MTFRATGTPPVTLADATAERHAWVEVDLDAASANLRTTRSVLAPGTEVIAVVKANAYGHGAAPVARTLQDAGAERFAVAWVDEAIDLRRAGIEAPILVMGHAFPTEVDAIARHRLTSTVHSLEFGHLLSATALDAGVELPVHLMVDTGIHREGLAPTEVVPLAHQLRELPGLRVEGLWTHMANADEFDDSFSTEQHRQFQEVSRQLDWVPYTHAANSATVLRRSELHCNGVRAGLMLYGLCPPNTPDPGLRPVMSVRARLARVLELQPGDGVSYGLAWRAERPSTVGLVPVGYGDGWRRSLGNVGSVLVNGVRCPMVGRVCMDQFLVDLTHLEGKPARGDVVTLLGEDGQQTITADHVAELGGTISWEVVTAVLPRLPRLYHAAGRLEFTG